MIRCTFRLGWYKPLRWLAQISNAVRFNQLDHVKDHRDWDIHHMDRTQRHTFENLLCIIPGENIDL